MSHRNARLTVHGRRTIVERVLIQGRPRSHVAKEMGVSRQCVSRWIARYQAEGEPGLQERSSRPHHPASRTCPEVEQRVLAVREDERRGQDWIGPELGVPARTVSCGAGRCRGSAAVGRSTVRLAPATSQPQAR